MSPHSLSRMPKQIEGYRSGVDVRHGRHVEHAVRGRTLASVPEAGKINYFPLFFFLASLQLTTERSYFSSNAGVASLLQ